MQMSDEAFADYAATLEKQDFEDDVRGLSSTLHQLVTAREDTINKLRISADYLDSIWTRYISKRYNNNLPYKILTVISS